MGDCLDSRIEKKTILTFVDEEKHRRLTRSYEGLISLQIYEVVQLREVPKEDSVRPGEYVVRPGKGDEETRTEFFIGNDGSDRVTRYYVCNRIGPLN